ncbi:hypothetical protein BKG76_00325 [Mycobacteroides franklinii]|uniref:Pyrrolo-quinoline quinone repeat domain-containing protein n=2 Tax=Mycobacteroides franklinii TaxID=948102 RepID=A0A1S1LGK3_9MYCO|nr:hypothetical protein BKG76_00325 [Mycobacteroides franklinii]
MVSAPITASCVVGLVAAAAVVLVIVLRPVIRRKEWSIPVGAAVVVIVALTCFWIPKLSGVFRDGGVVRFVDTTGVTILSAEALAAGVAALVFGSATAFVVAKAQPVVAAVAFLAVIALISSVAYQRVQSYRTQVWYPSLIAMPATPAALPETFGTLRYQIPQQVHDNWTMVNVYSTGTGFVMYTPDGVMAYDGPTGALRWRADGLGASAVKWASPFNALDVVWFDREHSGSVVVVSMVGALLGLDGDTGTVLWRRQYRGDLTQEAGSVDALAFSTYDVDVGDTGATTLYSVDPRTGKDRWSRHSDCSNLKPGAVGQFVQSCSGGPATVVDAHTGNTAWESEYGEWLDVSIDHEVYVASGGSATSNTPKASDTTWVLDRSGNIIDQVAGTFPLLGHANAGHLLLDGVGQTALLRNYRTHQSTPLRLGKIDYALGMYATWLPHRLIIEKRSALSSLHMIDLDHPDAEPTALPWPCRSYLGDIWQLKPAPGVIVASCQVAGDHVAPEINGYAEPVH